MVRSWSNLSTFSGVMAVFHTAPVKAANKGLFCLILGSLIISTRGSKPPDCLTMSRVIGSVAAHLKMVAAQCLFSSRSS